MLATGSVKKADHAVPEAGGRYRYGLDIGGTKIDAVLVDGDAVIAHARVPSGRGLERVVTQADLALRALQEDQGLSRILSTERPQLIGVGVPGLVDGESGRVRNAVNLDLVDVDLKSALQARTGLHVAIDKDVNAAALGTWATVGRPDSLGYINLGTGLAAGVVISGDLWRGSRGFAGEVGHIPVDPSGRLCTCGQVGCLETLASGAAIAARWPTQGEFPILEIEVAARAGDPLARAIFADLVEGAAATVRLLLLSFDVQEITIGGGLSSLGDVILDPVRAKLAEWAFTSSLVDALITDVPVGIAPSGPIAALGASMLHSLSSAA
jgi:predicted NBD/HSP70 family sugar kinase